MNLEVFLHSFSTSVIDRGNYLTSRFGRFIPGKGFLCPVNKKPFGVGSISGYFGEQKRLVGLPGFERRSMKAVVYSV